MPTRGELIKQLEWNRGGYGFGVCEAAGSILWAMDEPGPGKPDLKSIVAVSGPRKKYTTEELRKIVAFSERQTAGYDKLFRYRRGANLILLNKESDGRWMRKRLTWKYGPMYSHSLDEALAAFESKGG